jgi:hypothetical protein
MDSTSNIAEALAHVEANGINVAVSGAAAILDVCLGSVEAILEAIVDSIEAITETIGDATELSVHILVVETFEEVRAGECTLYCGITVSVTVSEYATIAENGKPYKIDKGVVPKFAIHKAICVITSNSGDIGGCEFMRHIYVLLLKYNIF